MHSLDQHLGILDFPARELLSHNNRVEWPIAPPVRQRPVRVARNDKLVSIQVLREPLLISDDGLDD